MRPEYKVIDCERLITAFIWFEGVREKVRLVVTPLYTRLRFPLQLESSVLERANM